MTTNIYFIKGLPYKTQPNTVNHVLYFYFFKDTANVINNSENVPSPVSSKNNVPTIHFCDIVHQKWFWRIQRIFMQCTWVFSTLYSTVLTINVSTQLEPWFICKKQNVQHMNFCLWKKSRRHLRDYHATGSQQNWSKAMNVCWTTQQLLEVSTAIFRLRLIRYTVYY
jgi:hypothetical protein